MTDEAAGELLQADRGVALKLPELGKNVPGLTQDYRTLYKQLLTNALSEFPPVQGYETGHAMIVERLVYFYVKQKQTENNHGIITDIKEYKLNINAFIRTFESILKEMRSISAEATFKHAFVIQVVEILDRMIGDQGLKQAIAKELGKLAQSQ